MGQGNKRTVKQRSTKALNQDCSTIARARSGCLIVIAPLSMTGFDVAALLFRRQEATRNAKSRANAHPSCRSRILVIGLRPDLDNFILKLFDLELSCARILVAKFLAQKVTFEPCAHQYSRGLVSGRNLGGSPVSNL